MRTTLVAASLCATLCSQTYVVDAAGGGNFTDLPQAIAAVPSGAVLRVRPGSYSPFTVANTSLTILGDDPNTVVVQLGASNLRLGPITANQKVLLQGFRVTAATPLGGSCTIVDAAGQVVLDRITMDAPAQAFLGASQVLIQRCANVHLSSVRLLRAAAPDSGPLGKLQLHDSVVEMRDSLIEANPGRTAFGSTTGTSGIAAMNSVLFCTNLQVVGGSGGVAGGCGLGTPGPNDGGPGVMLSSNSVMHAVRCTFTGGDGGSGIMCRPGGARGGVGLDIEQSAIRGIATTLLGGPGGSASGQPGAPMRTRSGAVLDFPALPAAHATLKGTVAPNQPVTLSLAARAGDMAVVALGYDQVFVPVTPLITTGALMVVPELVLGPYVVPPTGVLDIALQLPASWPIAQWIPFQFVTAPPTVTELWASNSVGLLAR